MVVEVICGTIIFVVGSSLGFSRWYLKWEEETDPEVIARKKYEEDEKRYKEEEQKRIVAEQEKVRCPSTKVYGFDRKRCTLEENHHGPHLDLCEDKELWWH